MKVRILSAVLGGWLVLTSACFAQAQDPVSYVDPFIGSTGGGNTVPGASVPFGFVNFSPDTTHGDTNGYDDWSPVVGFSLTHVSGTGGNSKYGNFRVAPTIGAINPRNPSFPRRDERASPGYYSVILGDPSIQVELTSTRLVGIQRLTFPKGAEGNVLIDVTSSVQLGGGGQRASNAHVSVHTDGSLSGWASFTGGWNGAPYTLFFYAVFDRTPATSGTWTVTQGASTVTPGSGEANGGDQRSQIGNRLGAYESFETTTNTSVTMKMAVSFISEAKARANLQEAADWDFDALRARAVRAWSSALGQIEVSGGTEANRRIFYTALYRSHTMPHDLSGENVWWSSTEPHYEDFYTLWDTFRTLHPLMTLIQPQRQRDMIRSLLDTYDHTGWLPDARIAGANGLTQGGSNGDVLIADAVVKNLGGFDQELAYTAIKKDGDLDSPDPMNVGRSLKNYLTLGYMPLSETRSASRTLEYAYDDFAISEVAQTLDHKDDAARFLARSGGWQKLWDNKLGCIHPRYTDGSWLENYDCTYTYPDSTTPWWDAPYYEGSGLQYSTYVPHDVAGLIQKIGGPVAFVAWLDRLFDGHHYDQGNEPDLLAPYLYIYAGRPDKTADRVRQIMANRYSTGHTGLPGNDDAGAMSSWYVWSAMGLYPNAGQPLYYIGSPLFDRATLHLEDGKRFTVEAHDVSELNRYVLGARLNGKPLDRAWLSHAELIAGGQLELEMGPVPGTWATRTLP